MYDYLRILIDNAQTVDEINEIEAQVREAELSHEQYMNLMKALSAQGAAILEE